MLTNKQTDLSLLTRYYYYITLNFVNIAVELILLNNIKKCKNIISATIILEYIFKIFKTVIRSFTSTTHVTHAMLRLSSVICQFFLSIECRDHNVGIAYRAIDNYNFI